MHCGSDLAGRERRVAEARLRVRMRTEEESAREEGRRPPSLWMTLAQSDSTSRRHARRRGRAPPEPRRKSRGRQAARGTVLPPTRFRRRRGSASRSSGRRARARDRAPHAGACTRACGSPRRPRSCTGASSHRARVAGPENCLAAVLDDERLAGEQQAELVPVAVRVRRERCGRRTVCGDTSSRARAKRTTTPACKRPAIPGAVVRRALKRYEESEVAVTHSSARSSAGTLNVPSQMTGIITPQTTGQACGRQVGCSDRVVADQASGMGMPKVSSVMSSGSGPPRMPVSRASIAASSSAVSSKSKTSKFSAMRAGLVGLRDDRAALLQVPAQHDLGRRLAVRLGDRRR